MTKPITLTDYEQMTPHAESDGITFMTPNQHCAWRVDSLHTKEPDTIAWIDKMPKDAILFDVGANMGQYSLFAARRGITVHAFEPESQNFALMCRNIALNKRLRGTVMPWPVAFTNYTGLDKFHVTTLIPGGSCNTFGEAVDYYLKPKKFAFEQGCFGMRMDEFCEEIACWPDHIKIDVDGIEHKVLLGAREALTKAESVLVEINTALAEHQEIFALMEMYAFKPDMETADKARRTQGAFKGIGNVIFYKL